jgi:hypothetical protein
MNTVKLSRKSLQYSTADAGSYLHMPVNKPVEFNVIVVFTERIDKNFSYFQPSDIETELKQSKELQMT